MAAIIAYWPAVVAGLYLLYILAAGQTTQLQPAIAAFVATLVTHGAGKINATASAACKAMRPKPVLPVNAVAFKPKVSQPE